MAQPPINYMQGAINPFEQALSGFKAGASIADAMRAREQQRMELESRQKILEIGNTIRNNPNATAEDYAKFAMLLPPEQAKSVRESWQMMGEERQQAALKTAGQVFSALNSGQPEIAVDMLNQHAEAARNTPGQEKQAQYFETWANIAKTNPDAARMNFGTTLSLFPGGDKVIEGVSKIGEERRREEMQPGALEKQAADLGLTREQTNKVMVETKKLGVETAKTALELEALQKTGGIDPAASLESEDKLRKEYIGLTKDFRDVQGAYQRMLVSDNTAAGDIALIFNYMKMLDPGSVVREGEFATAQNAAGVPDRISNAYNRALSGERLSADQRKQFTGQAERLYSGAERGEAEIRKGFARIAGNYGLNPENIFFSPGGPEKPQVSGQNRAQYSPSAAAPSAAPAAKSITVDY